MRYCPKCNHISGDIEVKFCWQDGTELRNYPTCPKCGKEQAPINSFCEYCGMELKK